MTEFLTCGICCYLQVDSVGIELAGVSVCGRGDEGEKGSPLSPPHTLEFLPDK